MTSRRASEGAGSVLSFTFLDVLMCTMGSLLLLLVVFGVIAKKARARMDGEEARISLAALKLARAPQSPPAVGGEPGAETPGPQDSNADDPAELARKLEQVRSEQAEIEKLRAKAADRRRQEQDRIAHLEDHERRLEHELAQLHMTLEALEATEQKQTVDQTQADAEVKRLRELVKETEARLADMRKNGAKDKSYAIVPYKGANGTFRRPVFVECTEDAVTIQPEGIRLLAEDFDGPLRSGNPLAAAMRAAHEELNARAVAAGQKDMPDAYPLIIVRPAGSAAYAAAVDAIRSWDSDYGYEFVESDWKLKYPEPDPRLAQVMAHAVDEARQRQALLAKVAPRRYASRLTGGGGAGSGGGGGVGDGSGSRSGGGDGFNTLAYGGGSDGMGPHASGGALGGDPRNSLRGAGGRGASGGARSAGGNFSDEFKPSDTLVAGGGSIGHGGGGNGGSGSGGANGAPGGAGGASAQGADANSRYIAGTSASGGPNSAEGQGGRYGEKGGDGTAAGGSAGDQARDGSQSGGAGDANSMAGGGTSGSASSGASGGAAGASGAEGGTAGAGSGSTSTSSNAAMGSSLSAGGSAAAADPNAGPPSMSYTKTVGSKSSAESRSKSAAESRGVNWANVEASRRSSAVTRPVKVLVSTEQLAVLGDGGNGSPDIVSFQQPTDRVMDQLAGVVQDHIKDWGLAGKGMYWRPTLVVSVAPGAERQAARLAELLENSGIDVRLPQTTANAAQGGARATR